MRFEIVFFSCSSSFLLSVFRLICKPTSSRSADFIFFENIDHHSMDVLVRNELKSTWQWQWLSAEMCAGVRVRKLQTKWIFVAVLAWKALYEKIGNKMGQHQNFRKKILWLWPRHHSTWSTAQNEETYNPIHHCILVKLKLKCKKNWEFLVNNSKEVNIKSTMVVQHQEHQARTVQHAAAGGASSMFPFVARKYSVFEDEVEDSFDAFGDWDYIVTCEVGTPIYQPYKNKMKKTKQMLFEGTLIKSSCKRVVAGKTYWSFFVSCSS